MEVNVLESDNWNLVTPDVIYNRFDLMIHRRGIKILLQIGGGVVPCIIENNLATCGTYLMTLSYGELTVISEYIFTHYPEVCKVSFYHVIIKDNSNNLKCHNDFHIDLPANSDDLDARLSKKARYNIKRELRLINENIGKAIFKEYTTDCPQMTILMERYFQLKKKTHNRDYAMTAHEYLKNYYVTNIYTLEVKNEILAMVLSCEQGEVVYIENLTYNTDYAKFSPGQVIYDWYLKNLILKRKKRVFLSGGDLSYKKRYGGIEEFVCDPSFYSKNLKGICWKVKDNLIVYTKQIYMALSPKLRLRLKQIVRR